MIARRTGGILKDDVVFPRLLYCDSRCSLTCRRRSQVHPKFSPAPRDVAIMIRLSPMVLLYQSSEIRVTLKAGRNALLGSDALLKVTHLSLHFTSSQTLLEASSD